MPYKFNPLDGTLDLVNPELTYVPEDIANKAIDFTTINNILYPSVQAVETKILQQIANNITGLTAYFLYNTASDIPGYLEMLVNPSVGGIQNILSTGVTSNQLLASFATNPGFPNILFLPSGIIRLIIHAQQTGGTKVSQLYAKFYQRDLSGTETLLATSGNSLVLNGVDSRYEVDGVISGGVTFLSTDRIVVKIYALISSGGSAPSIELNVEDNTGSRIELPTISDGAVYSPSNPSDWAGTPPTTVQQALDRIANLIVTLNSGNPIP